MTEPVRPLEALIAEWRQNAIDADRARDSGDNIDWDAGEAIRQCAEELAALLQAAAPPAPTAEQAHLRELVDALLDDEPECPFANNLASHLMRMGLIDTSTVAAPPERVSEGKAVCEWVADSDGTDLYETSCGEDFVALEGCELDFVKFCCYCGKPARVLLEPDPARPAVDPPERVSEGTE